MTAPDAHQAPQEKEIIEWVVTFARKYPLTEANLDAISAGLARKTRELCQPHFYGWIEYFRETQPQWTVEQARWEAFNRVAPGMGRVGDHLQSLLLMAWQDLQGQSFYDVLKNMVAHEATEYQVHRHQLDMNQGLAGFRAVKGDFARWSSLMVLLDRRGEGGLEYELSLRTLVEPIAIRFYKGHGYAKAEQALQQRMREQGINDRDEAVRRQKLSAAYVVLAVWDWDQPYAKRFGNKVGDIEYTVTPNNLLWRDMIRLFDGEVIKSFFADLLGNPYPNPNVEDAMYCNLSLKKRKQQVGKKKRGKMPRPDTISLDERIITPLVRTRDDESDTGGEDEEDLDSPLDLVAANEHHADAHAELAALMEQPELRADDRELLTSIRDWLQETGAKRLNLHQFCRDTGRDYTATRKRYYRLVQVLRAS